MTFPESVRSCLAKYAMSRGRASRSEYWYFVLFQALAGFAFGLVGAIAVADSLVVDLLSAIVPLALLLPTLAVTIRRLHDTGYSGKLLLWPFLFLGLIIFAAVLMPAGADAVPAVAMLPLGMGAIGYGGIGVWLFLLMLQRGTSGPNRYGPDPLANAVP